MAADPPGCGSHLHILQQQHIVGVALRDLHLGRDAAHPTDHVIVVARRQALEGPVPAAEQLLDVGDLAGAERVHWEGKEELGRERRAPTKTTKPSTPQNEESQNLPGWFCTPLRIIRAASLGSCPSLIWLRILKRRSKLTSSLLPTLKRPRQRREESLVTDSIMVDRERGLLGIHKNAKLQNGHVGRNGARPLAINQG